MFLPLLASSVLNVALYIIKMHNRIPNWPVWVNPFNFCNWEIYKRCIKASSSASQCIPFLLCTFFLDYISSQDYLPNNWVSYKKMHQSLFIGFTVQPFSSISILFRITSLVIRIIYQAIFRENVLSLSWIFDSNNFF